ncbi:MazG-like family protein [Avibacterium sp. 21-594]|uniref:MazG-like family protein n=1 Tax=Avibacterium sp. 21-594 TaxID=2911535 RepID=UPI002247228B|nr:MazG-like family protein [Avibacterium sp. 21-594]MCW9716805.1 MazG-like family protein [Avibacterium sp. 21-594]
MEDIIQKIEQWAEERNLITGSTTHKQMLKLLEEFGELCGGVSKNKPEIIKDSIGDCMVVMIIMNRQLSNAINIPSLLNVVSVGLSDGEISDEEKDSTLLLISKNIGNLSHSIGMLEAESIIDNLALTIGTLFLLSTKFYLDFNECLQYAYEQIKDRKGKMIDGVFIKEDDLPA